MSDTVDIDDVIGRSMVAWRPPPRLSLSEWADRYFVLSAESAAEPGKWRCIPYQRGILDAFTDPSVEWVIVMKSARIGWTKMIDILAAYSIVQDPCPITVVQPTIEDAEGFSKEEIDPMIRDVPEVGKAIPNPDGPGQTLLHKKFPGGSLSMIGANSGRGFRRVSRKIMLYDETDGYPPSAGDEGDQIKLGVRRTEYYWDRKIGAGSTPLVAGASRIEKLYEQGDQRRYFVPCPQCGHMAPLVFRGEGGHSMKWPEGRPRDAYFVCQQNGCIIEHKDKRQMVERGEWRAAKPFNRKASFHIWAAYSYAPNATWGQIAEEFTVASAEGAESLKTCVNTVLGETWQERGEAPDWERLYAQREAYPIGQVPKGAILVTAGVDVQRNRLVYEVVAWSGDKQSWSLEIGVIPGDPALEAGSEGSPWDKINELLDREWRGADDAVYRIAMLAVDSGDNTNAVYNWGRTHPMSQVIATKGTITTRTVIGSPTPVDVTVRGKRMARGYHVWPIGADVGKSDFYGYLRLKPPTKESGLPYPPGFCHYPEYGEDYFKQITSEHLVKVVNKKGFIAYEWQLLPGRENHYLDARVYARAAAYVAGLDRYAASQKAKGAPATAPENQVQRDARAAAAALRPTQTPAAAAPRRGTWLGPRNGAIGRGRPWIRR